MSDWSSFNDDKATFDAWREFVNEEEVTAVEDEELLREIDWRMVGKAALKMGGEVLKQALPFLLSVVIKYVPEAVQSARDFMYGGYWTGHVQAGFATLSPARRAAVARELEDSYEMAAMEVRASEEESTLEVAATDDELPTDIFGSLPGVDSLLGLVDRAASSFGRSDSESTTTSEAKVKKKKEQSLLDQRVAMEKQINAETQKIATQLLAKATAAADAGKISKEELVKYREVIARRVKAMKAAAYHRATAHALKATAKKRVASLGATLSTTRSDSEGEKKEDPTEEPEPEPEEPTEEPEPEPEEDTRAPDEDETPAQKVIRIRKRLLLDNARTLDRIWSGANTQIAKWAEQYPSGDTVKLFDAIFENANNLEKFKTYAQKSGFTLDEIRDVLEMKYDKEKKRLAYYADDDDRNLNEQKILNHWKLLAGIK